MLKNSVLHVLEKTINYLLEKDRHSIERLQPLEDKIIVLSITTLPLDIYWLFENHRVRLLPEWRTKTDACITGPLSAFVQLSLPDKSAAVSTENSRWGINKGENRDSPPYSSPNLLRASRYQLMPVKELTISGDLAAVEAFKKLFSQLDLNLEEQLAPIIGDAFAFKLGKTLQQAANLFKKTTLRMRDNSREFLQEETLIVPPAEMVEDFANDIQKLNRDIDRLTHRVKTLVNRE